MKWRIAGFAIVLLFGPGLALRVMAHPPLLVHAPLSVAATSSVPAAVPDISKTPPSQVAERNRLLGLLDPHDPTSIFAVVDAIEADPALSISCHEIAHDVGHKAYELYGFAGAMNFSDATRMGHASLQDICAGGYVHGVLEEAALHQSDFAADPGALCAPITGPSRDGCYHGVGHALMFSYNRDTVQALAGCRTVGSAHDTYRCFEGIWMEFFWGSTYRTGPGSLGWDPAQPLAPCEAAAPDAQPTCFLYSVFGYLRNHPKNYTGAVALCTHSALSDSNIKSCLKGVGITMISRFGGKNLEGSENYVAGLTHDEKYSFYQGVFGYALLSGIAAGSGTCDRFVTDGDICREVLAGGV